MKITHILFVGMIIQSFGLSAQEPIENRMTWYNKSFSGHDGVRYHLHISELPENSKCDFGSRKFDPSTAIDKSLTWVKENGFNFETLLIEDVVIHTMGMGWQDCVYIVSVLNEIPWVTLEIGVSLDGETMYVPEIQ